MLECMLVSPKPDMKERQCDVIDCLFTYHGIHPEIALGFEPTPFILNTPHILSESDPLGGLHTEVTLWHLILLKYYYLHCLALDLKDEQLTTRFYLYGYCIEKLLEQGADPYFYLSVTNSPRLWMRVLIHVQGEIQQLRLTVDYIGGENLGRFPDRAPYEGENISLADLVERWDFNNKARILELIERNTLMRKGVNADKENILPVEEHSKEVESANTAIVGTTTRKDLSMFSSSSTPSQVENSLKPRLATKDMAGGGGPGRQNMLTFGAAISVGILILGERCQ